MKVKRAYRLSKRELYVMENLQKRYEKAAFEIHRWPEIYWGFEEDSRKIIEKEHWEYDIGKYDIDLLGRYVYQIGREGRVELFYDKIMECSSDMADRMAIDPKVAFEDLCLIVLLHELGHWFTHWCHSENSDIRRAQYYSLSTLEKECLAQLSVIWPMNHLRSEQYGRVKMMMEILSYGQSYPYKVYHKFSKKYGHAVTTLNRYSRLLDHMNSKIVHFDSIEFLLTGKMR